MNDLYYNKYLKYKQKYLDLKYGGQPFYVPPHARNSQPIAIKESPISAAPILYGEKGVYVPPHARNPSGIDAEKWTKRESSPPNWGAFNKKQDNRNPLPIAKTYTILSYDDILSNIKEMKNIHFKNKLSKLLEDRGYSRIPYNLIKNYSPATFIFVHDQKTYPVTKKEIHDYFNQFKSALYINRLYGDYMNRITRKGKLQKMFPELKEYFAPYRIITKSTPDAELEKIFSTGSKYKIIKAETSHSGLGTKIIKNITEIKEYLTTPVKIEFNNVKIEPTEWIVEDYMETTRIENRLFYMRVYVIIVKLKDTNPVIYMSNKHPYFISKTSELDPECNNEDPSLNKNIQDCTDRLEGSHLPDSYFRGGYTGNTYNMDGNSIPYDIKKNAFYPKNLPDGFSNDQIIKINKQLDEIILTIFGNKGIKEIKVDRFIENGYEMYGLDLSILKSEVLLLHEINYRTGLPHFLPYIEDLIKIILDNKNEGLDNLTKIFDFN